MSFFGWNKEEVVITDKRRDGKELCNEELFCKITKSDKDFLIERTTIEANSMAGVVRRCIRFYKIHTEKEEDSTPQ